MSRADWLVVLAVVWLPLLVVLGLVERDRWRDRRRAREAASRSAVELQDAS